MMTYSGFKNKQAAASTLSVGTICNGNESKAMKLAC